MLTIQPIENKDKQSEYCDMCGVEYMADSLAYSCYEGENFVGVCQFHLHDGGVYIDSLATKIGVEDYGAKFIMGRAALNFADLADFHDAYYPAPDDEKLCAHIGFSKNDCGIWYMDLRGFFEGPCKCEGGKH